MHERSAPVTRTGETERAALVRRYVPYVALLLLYYLAARLVGTRPALGTSLPSLLGFRIVPDLILAYIVGRAAWIGVVRTRTLADFKAALRADLLNARTAERLLGIPLFVLGTVLCFDVYGALKQAIPRLSAYVWDAPFAGLDWLLHLGRDPWTLTGWIPRDSAAFAFIDQVYSAWFMTTIVAILVFATWAPLRLRARFFVSLLIVLMVGGSLGAILFASAGPAYFGEFTGDHDRFAPLLQYIEGSRARDAQNMLWAFYSSGSDRLYGGISAMPSMHVALAVLVAGGFYSWSWPVGLVVALYAILIQVGSVHLGWHYAIDGYASMLLAVVVWGFTGRLVGRPAPEPDETDHGLPGTLEAERDPPGPAESDDRPDAAGTA